MTTSITRSCFTKQHQNCKTKTKTCFFLVSDRSYPKTDGLRPHHRLVHEPEEVVYYTLMTNLALCCRNTLAQY